MMIVMLLVRSVEKQSDDGDVMDDSAMETSALSMNKSSTTARFLAPTKSG